MFKILLILIFGFQTLNAQHTQDLKDALVQGNAKNIGAYFDNRIDLSIPENEGNYSKQQAIQILDNFISFNGWNSFQIVTEKSNAVGTIIKGKFRTTLKNLTLVLQMKNRNGKDLIQQLRIE